MTSVNLSFNYKDNIIRLCDDPLNRKIFQLHLLPKEYLLIQPRFLTWSIVGQLLWFKPKSNLLVCAFN